jgi:hypothetical protein
MQSEDDCICHAVGCDQARKPGQLMCAKHWFMVPPYIQGQMFRFKKESTEATTARDLAISWVALKEKRITPAEFNKTRQRFNMVLRTAAAD